ncbi:LysR family transcriptional regulator [Rhodanobacter aciditrophus]|uniref:LysR family transcriptional regulator n=1 Tax=Rhodanobacter aciditrophus TaxID=1623218 RepID=A0ABW4AVP3_9GAMM
MDTLEAMRRFLVVAETGSFTDSADRLDVPKSAISSSIQRLEKRLGIRLFHRSTRRVTLTSAGEDYLPECQRILNELEQLESTFQSDDQVIRGALKVDMANRFFISTVLPHLADFLAQYPLIDLRIHTSDQRIDPIKEGIDCLVRAGELTDSSLIARPLGRFNMVNCASAEYIEKHGRPESLEDLQQHKLIEYMPAGSDVPRGFEYEADGHTYLVQMPTSVTVTNTDAYRACCLKGLGIVQLPENGIKEDLSSGRLVEVLPEFRPGSMPVSILYPSRRLLPKRVSVFMDWLSTLMQK